MRTLAAVSTLCACSLLAGCYSLLTVNVGVNKTAGSVGTPMTPEAYCMALLAPNISLTDIPPTLSTEQKQYCQKVLERPPSKESKHARSSKADKPQ